MELEGKTAIVTGASSGIGASTVRKLREAGVRVVGGARRVERIDADVALYVDVTDEESSAAFVTQAVAELGGSVDILFNNAGLALGRYPFTESNLEDEATVLHTNVDGVLRITRLTLPHIRDGGHILFMGSVAGTAGVPERGVVRRGEVRAARFRVRAPRGSPRTADPDHDGGRRARRGTEFSLVRFKGDAEKAASVYEGVDPISPDEVADCILFALTRPLHVNVDEIVIKALQQSSGARIVRRGE